MSRDFTNVGQWNAWVEAGKTPQERRRRLAETPEKFREAVEIHVKTVAAIKRRIKVGNE